MPSSRAEVEETFVFNLRAGMHHWRVARGKDSRLQKDPPGRSHTIGAGRRFLTAGALFFGISIACLTPSGSIAGPDCRCRYFGEYIPLGGCICMRRPNGSGDSERACCVMVLNNTSWSFTGKSCPVADAQPPALMKPSMVAPALSVGTASGNLLALLRDGEARLSACLSATSIEIQ